MEIKQENIVSAYMTADDNGKAMLRALFPDAQFEAEKTADKRPVTERVKTLDDACEVLGRSHPLVCQYYGIDDVDSNLSAYLKLRIICAALNEEWEPQFTEDECRYYPWFWLYTQEEIDDMDDDDKQDRHMMSTGDYQTGYAGFASAYSNNAPSHSTAYIGSRLCLKNSDLATYCGKQFINLWADFNLIRK